VISFVSYSFYNLNSHESIPLKSAGAERVFVFSHEHNYHHPQEESIPEEHIPPTLSTESSYWIIEDQAFSMSYDLAPTLLSPPPAVSSSATQRKTEKEKTYRYSKIDR